MDDIDSANLECDDEMWFSLTPHEIAKVHGAVLACLPSYGIALDSFCGFGGDLIRFPSSVFGLGCDIVLDRLLKARRLKDSRGQTEADFVLVDSMASKSCFRQGVFDAVYLSPPWGHEGITNRKKSPVFGTRRLISLTVDGFAAFLKAAKHSPNIMYYLPRGMDPAELKLLAETIGSAVYVHVHRSFDPDDETVKPAAKHKVRAITAYFGALEPLASSFSFESR